MLIFYRLFLKSALRSFFLEFTNFILYLSYRRGAECAPEVGENFTNHYVKQ